MRHEEERPQMSLGSVVPPVRIASFRHLAEAPMMRQFEFHRDEDVSGTSGTGVVAQGVVFEDGTVALRWLTTYRSTALYDGVDDLELIHGHDGRTRIVFLGEAIPSTTRASSDRSRMQTHIVPVPSVSPDKEERSE